MEHDAPRAATGMAEGLVITIRQDNWTAAASTTPPRSPPTTEEEIDIRILAERAQTMALTARNIHRQLHEAVAVATAYARNTGETRTANEALAQLDGRMRRAREIEMDTESCAEKLLDGRLTEDEAAGLLECQAIMLERLEEFSALVQTLSWRPQSRPTYQPDSSRFL